MTQSGFLWMCYQNWSTLSILKILNFPNIVQKSGLFLLLEKFGPKKVTGFLAYPPPGGVGVGEWIFSE